MVYQVENELHDELSTVGAKVIIDSKGVFWKIELNSINHFWNEGTQQRECSFYAKKVDEYGNTFGNRKFFQTSKETVNRISGCWKKN